MPVSKNRRKPPSKNRAEAARQKKARRAAEARRVKPTNIVRIGEPYWPYPWPDLLGLGALPFFAVHPAYQTRPRRLDCR